MSRRIITSASLVVVNLIPLFGINGLNAFNILLIYWLEGLILGVFTLIKIVSSKKESPPLVVFVNGERKTLSTEPEIIKNYLLFLLTFGFLHGMVIFFVFRNGPVVYKPILISLAGLTISHAISYFVNYIGGQEYKRVSPKQLVDSSLMRIVVMHLVVLGTAFFFGNKPIVGVEILVAIKIILDLYRHNSEHSGVLSDV